MRCSRLPWLVWIHFLFNLYLFFFFFFFLVHPLVAGFAFCFHWRQNCWPLERDHIFHLILVYSDERKAVFIPLHTERDGAHLCHPPPLHRTEVNAGLTPYEWLFTRSTNSPQWSNSPPLNTSDGCFYENYSPYGLALPLTCVYALHFSWLCWTTLTIKVVCLNK